MIQHSDSVFPLPLSRQGEGIDLRTWMATMAMQGIMGGHDLGVTHVPNLVAEWAVSIADALIEELNKPQS